MGWVVLIVDDTPDNLEVARTALQFHGAQVHTATNGIEGLRKLEEIEPTVILLDIRMPKMDGWTVFRTARGNPATAHIPIIAVTAYAMDNNRDDLLRAGFDGYIAKPFDVSDFVEEIARAVNRRAFGRHKPGDAQR